MGHRQKQHMGRSEGDDRQLEGRDVPGRETLGEETDESAESRDPSGKGIRSAPNGRDDSQEPEKGTRYTG